MGERGPGPDRQMHAPKIETTPPDELKILPPSEKELTERLTELQNPPESPKPPKKPRF